MCANAQKEKRGEKMRNGKRLGNRKGLHRGRGMGQGKNGTGNCRTHPWLTSGWRRNPEYSDPSKIPQAPTKEEHKQFLLDQKAIIENQLKTLGEPETTDN